MNRLPTSSQSAGPARATSGLLRPVRRGLLAAAVLLLAALLFAAESAWAGSFQVSPTRFEFPLNRRFTNYFTVSNNSGETLRLRVSTAFVDFDADGNSRELQAQRLDMAPWIVFNPRRITLEPGQKRVVRFSVRPPEQLPEGEYRTVVFFEELPERPDARGAAESGIRIKLLTRVGVTIYGQVGEPAAEVRLQERKSAVTAEGVQLVALVHNAGNGHAAVAVEAALLPDAEEGEALGQGEERVTLQPGQRRRLTVSLPRPAPGPYRLRVTVKSGERTWTREELPLTVGAAAP